MVANQAGGNQIGIQAGGASNHVVQRSDGLYGIDLIATGVADNPDGIGRAGNEGGTGLDGDGTGIGQRAATSGINRTGVDGQPAGCGMGTGQRQGAGTCFGQASRAGEPAGKG